MLRVQNLTCTYRSVIKALLNVSLDLPQGRIVGLLGPNGAGKTTTLRCITNEIELLGGSVDQGEIWLDKNDLRGCPTYKVAKLGISIVPEDRKLFMDLSVHQNLMMGAYTVEDKRSVSEGYEKILGYFPVLKELRRRLTGYLSGGEQQMLAIGRGLMSQPKVLLLDEPSIGLAPLIVADIFRIIAKINEESGTSILLVEQNVNLALEVSHFSYILESGQVALSGPSKELCRDTRVQRIYLGSQT